MANKLKAITTKAKALYKSGKFKKWTDAIKAASKSIGATAKPVKKAKNKVGAVKIIQKGGKSGVFKGYKKIAGVGGEILTVKDTDNTWYLTYIDSTHFYLSNSPDFKGNPYHVGQFRNRPFYNEVNEWLKETTRKQMKGGKKFGATREKIHKDTKSHNVNIRVVSGLCKITGIPHKAKYYIDYKKNGVSYIDYFDKLPNGYYKGMDRVLYKSMLTDYGTTLVPIRNVKTGKPVKK